MTISFLGVAGPSHTEFLEEGSQYMVKIPLPPQLRARTGLIPVKIVSAVDYVPGRDNPPVRSLGTFLHVRVEKGEHDMRQLGTVLLYLYFQ